MAFCNNCGREIINGIKYCTYCGSELSESENEHTEKIHIEQPSCEIQKEIPVSNDPRILIEEPKNNSKVNLQQNPHFQDETNEELKPITTAGYVGIFFLLSVPIIGWIFTLIWACGGCKKINKRNMARAVIILAVINLMLTLVAIVVFGFILAPMMDEYMFNYGFNQAIYDFSLGM